MKTVFINCSPKKKFSASDYFLSVQKFFVKGEKVKEVLKNKKDYERILKVLNDGDNVVFCLPLYIDCLPSHVISFLKEMEGFCLERKIKLQIYAIANNGYIEGVQSKALLQIFRNFCMRSGLTWGDWTAKRRIFVRRKNCAHPQRKSGYSFPPLHVLRDIWRWKWLLC